MKNNMMRRSRRVSASSILIAASLITTLAACDTQSLLEVDLPGRVGEDALADPRLAQTLANSVVADVECSWDAYVAAAAHHSDEWIASSGNATMARWGLRDVPPTFTALASGGCGSNYGLFTPLHSARVQAESNFERIQQFDDASVPGKNELLAMIRAYGTWPIVALSEGFCGSPIDGGDAVLSPAELAALAETRFTEAISLASAAGRDDLRNLALVGRARVRLMTSDWSGVIADASQVPEGFTFMATRDAAPSDRQNRHFAAINGIASSPNSQKHATIAPNYRELEWKGVADPRVDVYWDGTLGFDFFTKHWRHDKANSFDAPVLMASWREAQLFMAEAHAQAGDLGSARAILNVMHERAGLPPVTEADTPSRSEVIAHVIQERSREFFSEGGHRLRDHLYWRGSEWNVPFLGEAGSIHPNGQLLDPDTGAPLREYESWTCFPVPSIEQT